MSEKLFCASCSTYFPVSGIFSHIETNHIGPRSSNYIYDITCGDCNYQVGDLDGALMIEHCFKRSHQPSALSLQWGFFMKKEAWRVRNVIDSGVEILRANLLSKKTKNEPESMSSFNGSTPLSQCASAIKAGDLSGSETKRSLELCGERQQSKFNSRKTRKEPKTKGIQLTPKQIKRFENETKSVQEVAPETGDADKTSELIEAPSPDTTNRPNTSASQSEEETENALPIISPQTIEALSESTLESETTISTKSTTEYKLAHPNRKRKSPLNHLAKTYDCCQVCHLILTSSTRNFSNARLLSHAISHTKLNFVQCSKCSKEMSTADRMSGHRKVTGCIGSFVSIQTDEKMTLLRKMLTQCFPSTDFESDLNLCRLIGNKREFFDRNPRYAFKKRTEPASKGDCHLCCFNNFANTNDILHHIFSHSGLRLFHCDKCGNDYSLPSIARQHRKTMSGRINGCDGKYTSTATERDVAKLRNLLIEGFPEFDWNEKLPPGTMRFGNRRVGIWNFVGEGKFRSTRTSRTSALRILTVCWALGNKGFGRTMGLKIQNGIISSPYPDISLDHDSSIPEFWLSRMAKFGDKLAMGQDEKNDNVKKYMEDLQQRMNAGNLSRYLEVFMKRTDISTTLAQKLKMEALLVVGSKASHIHTVYTMHQAMPREKATLLVVDGVGDVMTEAPDRLTRALVLFAKGCGVLSGVAIPGMERQRTLSSSMEEADRPRKMSLTSTPQLPK